MLPAKSACSLNISLSSLCTKPILSWVMGLFITNVTCHINTCSSYYCELIYANNLKWHNTDLAAEKLLSRPSAIFPPVFWLPEIFFSLTGKESFFLLIWVLECTEHCRQTVSSICFIILGAATVDDLRAVLWIFTEDCAFNISVKNQMKLLI